MEHLVDVLSWLYAHPLAVLVLLGLLAAAIWLAWTVLADGRGFSFWQVKVDPRPEAMERAPTAPALVDQPAAGGSAPTGTAPGPSQEVALRSPELTVPDRLYGASHAREFYEEAATEYDGRNSTSLLRTHRKLVDIIKQIQRDLAIPRCRVLDLGGGTGKLVATMFYDSGDVHWTYVDFSPAMVSQFMQNLSGTPLAENYTVTIENILRADEKLPPASFDVAVLSLVLSSMPKPPDFGKIASLLAPGGRLLVADIAPTYTAEHPYYEIRRGTGTIALQMNPVEPLEIIQLANSAGLALSDTASIQDGEDNYSFILTFTRGGNI